ncbi:WD40-repeat-containing domain protein [Dipodascopsis tothii]|uniref:WD40-repeat-containing domain protein n=1 Tax=Dipodascopsis tothii TaxID=44089 RepID=UPI0034CD3656
MVKSYLRFESDAAFGVISGNSNVVWVPGTGAGSAGVAVTGALESTILWDIKKGDKLSKWNEADIKAEVSCVAAFGSELFAVGYSDGSVRVWDAQTGSVMISFNGHKAAINVLQFDAYGTRLASGSQDAAVIVWDLVLEVGLYKLRGHKDQITGLAFLAAADERQRDVSTNEWLVSVSKDGFVKLWDLAAQHCIETHLAHRGECWALGKQPGPEGTGRHRVATAGASDEIKFWDIDLAGADNERVVEAGSVARQSKDRAITLTFHPLAPFLAVHGSERAIEILRIRSDDEVKKAEARRRRRREKREKEKGAEAEAVEESEVALRYVPFAVVRTPAKVRSVDWALTTAETARKDVVQLLVGLTNNSLEYYSVALPEAYKSSNPLAEYQSVYQLDLLGHRTDPRALAISSDDLMIASASNGTLKVWNERSTNCIRTFECGYALSLAFLPGDTLLVAGTKAGAIELFDVASSALLETIEAHDGALWSLQVTPDGKGLVTASADKTVKFWTFKVVQEAVLGTDRSVPRMRLKHTRTLELSDDVLSVRVSPDGKYVAASLLDNTIKVFFADTLKFFLNLYGHKLPVLAMDISHDSKLLISSSADKNIKIWGLDFGDCHRSIFAHEDSIMAVAFEPGSHNFFSGAKDRLVKYWDGDKFENIQKLAGHRSEVWAVAVAHSGRYVVSAGHDKSIRIWTQTEDEIFLEEEREKEMEELFESTLVQSYDQPDEADGDADVAAVKKQTVETLMAGERVIEALDLGAADLDLLAAHAETRKRNPAAAPPARDAVFVALDNVSAERYVLDVLERVRASQLQDALLILPFEKVLTLLRFIDIWAEREWNFVLVARVLFFVVQTYHRQIVANDIMRPMLDSVRGHLRTALERQKDLMGYNIAALRYLRHEHELLHTTEFEDGPDETSVRKRAFTTVG